MAEIDRPILIEERMEIKLPTVGVSLKTSSEYASVALAHSRWEHRRYRSRRYRSRRKTRMGAGGGDIKIVRAAEKGRLSA
jgi:hypothetical protein